MDLSEYPIIRSLADLRRGMRVTWAWRSEGAGAEARAANLRPLGTILTRADHPSAGDGLLIQVVDRPEWAFDAVRALATGGPLHLLSAAEAPRVLNAKTSGKAVPGAIYVGRPSAWGNPFVVGRHGDRDRVLRLYIDWLHANPAFVGRVRQELAGKDLICLCHPEACHADILRDLAMGARLPSPIQDETPDLFPDA